VRVLITGCAGFIGSHLTESLLGDGHAVVGIDCFNDNYGRERKLGNLRRSRDWDAFDFVPIDMARGELDGLVADVDAVFHLAAEPGVRHSWGERFQSYVRNNLMATQHLLEAAVRLSPGVSLVYASSSSIYGQAETLPTSETATPAPHSPYGTTKLAAEHLCHAYHANHGLSVASLRFFSVFGPRQRPDMAFDSFCRAVLCDAPITVFGDGGQTRDFTYVADVVGALRLAADTPAAVGRAYNIGGGSQVSIRDALNLLGELAGRPLEIRYEPVARGDVRNTGADIRRAATELGFTAGTGFLEGLTRQFDWVRADLGSPTRLRV